MKSKKSKFLLTSLLVIVGTIMLVNSAVAESSKSDTIGGVPVYAFLSKFDYGARARTELFTMYGLRNCRIQIQVWSQR